MTQKSRPVSDVSSGSWSPVPVYPEVNEIVPDCGSIVTGEADGAAFTVNLAKLVKPIVEGPQKLTVLLRSTLDDPDICVSVELLHAGDVVARTTQKNPGTEFIDAGMTLTNEQKALIDDYGSLSVRVEATSCGRCADLPDELLGTITNKTGSCTSLPNQVTFTRFATGEWDTTELMCAGSRTIFACLGGAICEDVGLGGHSCFFPSPTLVSCQADPLEIVFNVSAVSPMCAGSFRITITEAP